MNVPDDVEAYLRLEFANRVELGMVVWQSHHPDRSGRFYSFEDTVAISHMVLRGWSLARAARACGDLIRAVPHVPGRSSGEIKVPELIYSVGYSRFADGSVWEILGDLDLPHADDYFRADTTEYGAVATRNLERCSDPVEDRLKHLITVGSVDDNGHFARGLTMLVGGGTDTPVSRKESVMHSV